MNLPQVGIHLVAASSANPNQPKKVSLLSKNISKGEKAFTVLGPLTDSSTSLLNRRSDPRTSVTSQKLSSTSKKPLVSSNLSNSECKATFGSHSKMTNRELPFCGAERRSATGLADLGRIARNAQFPGSIGINKNHYRSGR